MPASRRAGRWSRFWSGGRWSLTLATLIIGLSGAMLFRAQTLAARAELSQPADQARLLTDLLDANSALAQQAASLRLQRLTYQQVPRQNEAELLVADLNRLKMVNGLVEAVGDGVEIRTGAPLTEVDVQDLLNELRNSGAEAIALNEQRLTGRSSVGGGKEGLVVDGVALAPPYQLRAIGSPEALARGLERRGGVLPILRLNHPGYVIELIQRTGMVLPVFRGATAWQYAQR